MNCLRIAESNSKDEDKGKKLEEARKLGLVSI
jgi:hypothetical protein